MSNNEESPQGKEGKGLGSGRWHWEALKQAQTGDQFRACLAEVLDKVGKDDVALSFQVSGDEYAKIMGNAWFAKQYGEIEEISLRAYIDRAFQVMELNLKSISVRRRR